MKKTENAKTNTIESTSNTKNDTLTEQEMYKSVLDDYKKALNEPDIESFQSNKNIENKYNLVNLTLIEHIYSYQNEGINLTYGFYDIDKNGIKDLLVGANDNLGAIYSYDLSTQKPVKIFYQTTMERGDLAIYDNGIIFSHGSYGASAHYYEFGKISKDGTFYNSLEVVNEEYKTESNSAEYTDANTGKILNYTNANELKNKYLLNSEIVEISLNYEI